MHTIHTVTENGLNYFVLQNASKTSSAKICIDQGARLLDLKLKGAAIITEIADFDYKDSYASSILFPFVSRIKKGEYSFDNIAHQLKCNDGKNALHGLVYNKKFKLFEFEENKNNCAVTFNFIDKKGKKGFPFGYYISVTYALFENRLKVNVTVKNKDKKPFPFTLGWHPYFNADDLKNSSLSFKSDQKIKFSKSLVAKEVVAHKTPSIFKLGDKHLDDCFILNDSNVTFTTPAYKVEISSDAKENFLQLYTPKDKPLIAIEPMTGVSNSFNNKIGLQILEPKETYAVNWIVKILNN